MKSGPVLGAILAAAAIIASAVWFCTAVVEHERSEKAFDETMQRIDAYLRAVKLLAENVSSPTLPTEEQSQKVRVRK